MFRALRVPASLAVWALCACSGDLSLAPKPASPALTAQPFPDPAAAYAGQRLRLDFDGDVDASSVSVTIGGRTAAQLSHAERQVVVEVPFLEGSCERDLPITVTAASRPVTVSTHASAKHAGVLRYLGAGHPGQPRPQLAAIHPVRFVPDILAANRDGFFAVAFGTAVVGFDPGTLEIVMVRAADDFPSALAPVLRDETPVDGLAPSLELGYAGRYGTFGTLPTSGNRGGTGTPSGGFDLATTLPSVVFDGPSSLAFTAVPGATPKDTPELFGRAVGPADSPTPVFLQRTPVPNGAPLVKIGTDAALAKLGALQVANADLPGQFVAASGGATPAVSVVFPSGEPAVFPLPAMAAGLTMSPTFARTTPVKGGFAFAAAWIPSSKSGGPTPPPAVLVHTFQRDLAGKLQTPSVAPALSLTRPPDALDLITDKDGAVHLFVVEQGALRHATLNAASGGGGGSGPGGDGPSPAGLDETLRFERPARRMAARLSSDGVVQALVSDADGTLRTFAAASDGHLAPLATGRAHLGLSVPEPVSGSSCSGESVVVASPETDAAVVVPFRGGSPAAFLSGLHGTTGARALRLLGPSNRATEFFLGLTAAGPALVETTTQSHTFGRQPFSPALKLPESTLALDVIEDPETTGGRLEAVESVTATDDELLAPASSFVVASGPPGFAAQRLTYDAITHGLAAPITDGSCPGIVQTTSVGGRVVALAVTAEGSRLCSFDPLNSTVVKGPLLDAAWQVRRLASGVEASPETGGLLHHVFLGGRVTGGDRSRSLLLAHVVLEELGAKPPERLDFSDVWTVLPTEGGELTALGVSPDARRLFAGLSGSSPGLVSVDPLLLLRSRNAEERTRAVTTLSLPSAPVGFNFSSDGARATAVLDDDSLAELR